MKINALTFVFIACVAQWVTFAEVPSPVGADEEASLLQTKNSAHLMTGVPDSKNSSLSFNGAVLTGWTKEHETCSSLYVYEDIQVQKLGEATSLRIRTKRPRGYVYGNEECAKKFMKGLHYLQIIAPRKGLGVASIGAYPESPKKLVFATFGKLSMNLDGFVCTLSLNIGQGYGRDTLDEKWWLGAQNCNRLDKQVEKGDSLWCACDEGDGVNFQFKVEHECHQCKRRNRLASSSYEFIVEKVPRDPGCGAGFRPLCNSLPKIDGSTPFWKAPLVVTHDAGTGYAGGGTHSHIKSQFSFLHDQLACGARGLDLKVIRDTCNPDKPFYTYHRGDHATAWVHTGGNVDTTWPQVVQWCHENPDELVVGIISHCWEVCGGDWTKADCGFGGWEEAFTKHGGKAVSIGSGWTMDDAKAASAMEGGGHLMLITSSFANNNYDCFEGEGSRIEVVNALTPDGACQGLLLDEGNVHNLQAFRQQTSFTIPLDADLNLFLASGLIDFSKLPVGMLETNDVCAYGNDLAEYLGNTVTDTNRNKCKKACRDKFEEDGRFFFK